MVDYEVIWSREAIYDMSDIADYVELAFGEDRADEFVDEINQTIQELGTKFKLCTGVGIFYKEKLILRKIFSPSIIFFFVDEIKEKVYIIRILRHESDWQKILRETLCYTFE